MAYHGYQESIDAIMGKLTDRGQGGVGMYSRTFPYLAQIEVFPFPWEEEVAIYSISKNPATGDPVKKRLVGDFDSHNSGALSPQPAKSNVLHSKTCPPHCQICDHHGHCRKCKDGDQHST